MKQIIALFLTCFMLLILCSCGSAADNTQKENAKEQQGTPIITEADPKSALEEIYAQLDRSAGLVDADDDIVRKVMGFNLRHIDEYYIRYMEPDYGASDVYIIKPKKDQYDAVRESLKDWQEIRIQSFDGYDIYNSTAISENSVIFRRGDYLIMLMLEDNDTARSIIEQYIPEELNLEN